MLSLPQEMRLLASVPQLTPVTGFLWSLSVQSSSHCLTTYVLKGGEKLGQPLAHNKRWSSSQQRLAVTTLCPLYPLPSLSLSLSLLPFPPVGLIAGAYRISEPPTAR